MVELGVGPCWGCVLLPTHRTLAGGHVQGPGRASWAGPQAVGPGRWVRSRVKKSMEVAGFPDTQAPAHPFVDNPQQMPHSSSPQDVPPPALSLQLVDMGIGMQVHLF